MKKHFLTYLFLWLLIAIPLQDAFSYAGFSTDLATVLIQSLNAEQRAKMMFEFDDVKKYEWTYLPPYMIGRNGLPLKEMTADQQELARLLLKASLSESGFHKLEQIMSLENVLAEMENNEKRDPEMYFLSIFGNPEGNAPWAWQFDGHHVSLHFTITNDGISYTPHFFGSNPAEVRVGPLKGLRVLNREEDLGFELLNSFSAEQREKAIFAETAFKDKDIVSKNHKDVAPLDPVGLAYKDMSEPQQAILWELINEYLSNVPKEKAQLRKAKILAASTAEIRFGWAGITNRSGAHYYRVQGPTFLIELDNSQNNANHIHSVWRDFNGDFGRDLIAEHYQRHPH